MSRDINCDYCGEYLCSDYCDLEERVAQHYPDCMRALMEERDRLRGALERIAVYEQGELGSRLDEPAAAEIARDALEGKA